jgi:hypothetical protein
MIPAALVGKAAAALAMGLVGKRLWDENQRRAAIHRAFVAFSNRIKHEQFEERELLRERRELLTERLFKALPPEQKARLFTQGSYAMQTGVKPLRGEFDIDIGICFDRDVRSFSGPLQAKRMVRDALLHGSRRVEIRRSCVTVYYTGDSDLPDHHVDITVYAKSKNNQLMLAKGREHSAAGKCFWEPSQPELLTKLFRDKFTGEQAAQFRRCVRYLKRWKQVNFRSPPPHSIALTVAAYHWFRPNSDRWFEVLDDRTALLGLVRATLGEFRDGRLSMPLPILAMPDVLKLVTPKQMGDFKRKLEALERTLVLAGEQEVVTAISMLAGQFGSDFN